MADQYQLLDRLQAGLPWASQQLSQHPAVLLDPDAGVVCTNKGLETLLLQLFGIRAVVCVFAGAEKTTGFIAQHSP